jgi:hypothetical protein
VATITVSLAQHEAHVGSLVVPVELAGAGGSLRVGGDDGPVLRPVSFAARARLAHRALGTATPRDELVVALRRAATVTDGELVAAVAEILALHLAGAGSGGPCFADSVVLLARALGWGPDALEAVDAGDVDRLAGQLRDALAPPDDGWSRVFFAPAADGPEPPGSLDELRAALADDLLTRAMAPPSPDALGAPAAPDGRRPMPGGPPFADVGTLDTQAGAVDRPVGRGEFAGPPADAEGSWPPVPAPLEWPTQLRHRERPAVTSAPDHGSRATEPAPGPPIESNPIAGSTAAADADERAVGGGKAAMRDAAMGGREAAMPDASAAPELTWPTTTATSMSRRADALDAGNGLVASRPGTAHRTSPAAGTHELVPPTDLTATPASSTNKPLVAATATVGTPAEWLSGAPSINVLAAELAASLDRVADRRGVRR